MMKNNSVFYMYSNMDKSSQILLFLIILVSLMLISIFVINIITKKKNKKYDASVSNITRYSKAIEKEKSQRKIEIRNAKEDEETDFFEEEEPEVIEVISHDNSIEEISKMIENTLEQEPIDLTTFEEEQEKDAIISYDELVKRAGAKKIVYKVETKEDSIKEEKLEEIEELKEEPKTEYTSKFKTSQIISPIYGIQKEKEEKIDVILDVEDYLFKKDNNDSLETMDDMEFLGTLKTFRSELD